MPIPPQVRRLTERGLDEAYGELGAPDHISRRYRTPDINDPWRNRGGTGDDAEGLGTHVRYVDFDLEHVCLEAGGGSTGGTKGGVRTDGLSRKLRVDYVAITANAVGLRQHARNALRRRPQVPQNMDQARGCKATGGNGL